MTAESMLSKRHVLRKHAVSEFSMYVNENTCFKILMRKVGPNMLFLETMVNLHIFSFSCSPMHFCKMRIAFFAILVIKRVCLVNRIALVCTSLVVLSYLSTTLHADIDLRFAN